MVYDPPKLAESSFERLSNQNTLDFGGSRKEFLCFQLSEKQKKETKNSLKL